MHNAYLIIERDCTNHVKLTFIPEVDKALFDEATKLSGDDMDSLYVFLEKLQKCNYATVRLQTFCTSLMPDYKILEVCCLPDD